jgi:hypothetical protein
MIKYGELNTALSRYTYTDIHEEIPVEYYRRIMKAWFRANNNGLSWDVHHAASILLYLAFNEGYLRPEQLNANGLKTLDWAEKFLDQVPVATNLAIVDALRYA